jgi:mannose-6-phosphate isomerase-like protein (cupin superfamily)
MHPTQEERFTVVTGTLALQIGDRDHLLHAGETVVVPAGARHVPRNERGSLDGLSIGRMMLQGSALVL